MAIITTRLNKGSVLTSQEIDNNFDNINQELATKLESNTDIFTSNVSTTGNIIPTQANIYSLGSAAFPWKTFM